MRRRLTTALLPALVAAGCTTMEPRETRAPLDGRISYTPAAGLTVSLNRSAHVAIFDIVPGQGVGLVYPTAGWQDAELAGGFTPLTPAPTLYYHWYFSPATFAGFRSDAPSWQPRRPFNTAEPRFLLMVASEAPLDLEALSASPGALRRALGMATFTSVNPDRVMDQLVATVVPAQALEDWTTAHWVSWPADYAVERDARILWVRCADGNYDAVPSEFLVMACPAGRGLRVPPANADLRERAAPQGAPAVSRPAERVTVELDTDPVDRTPDANRPTTFRPGEDAFRARVIGEWEMREDEGARGHVHRESGRQTRFEPRERSAQPREQMPSRAGGASSTPARPATAPEGGASGTGGGGSTSRGTLPGGSD